MARARICAVDFDGTLVEHRYPAIGKPLPYAFETLKALKGNGIQLMLWTMRGHPDLNRFPHIDLHTGKYILTDTLQEAVDFCKEQGVEFDGVNLSPEQFSTSNKQYAHCYIDDAALGCLLTVDGFVDWEKVLHYLVLRKWVTPDQCWDILGVYHGHQIPEAPNPNHDL